MDIEKRINEIVDRLKVVNYQEELLDSESQFISIKRGFYQLNNGESIDRESVVKNVGSGTAAVIFAVDIMGNIILVVHPRIILPTKEKISVEVPAGYIEEGEDSVVAARRELEEETGYTTEHIFQVDSYFPSLGVSGERIDLFLAIDCVKNRQQHLDDDEFIISVTVTLDEFKELVDKSYIKGVNERLGYYHYLEYLGSDKNETNKKKKN